MQRERTSSCRKSIHRKPFRFRIDLIPIVDDLSIEECWELLQMVWDKLEQKGSGADWSSFYKDNEDTINSASGD